MLFGAFSSQLYVLQCCFIFNCQLCLPQLLKGSV